MTIINILIYFPPVFLMSILKYNRGHIVYNYTKLPPPYYDIFQIQKSLKSNTMNTHIAT